MFPEHQTPRRPPSNAASRRRPTRHPNYANLFFKDIRKRTFLRVPESPNKRWADDSAEPSGEQVADASTCHRCANEVVHLVLPPAPSAVTLTSPPLIGPGFVRQSRFDRI